MNDKLLVQNVDGLSDAGKATLQLLGGASGAVSNTQLAFLYDAIMLGVEKAIEKAQAEGATIKQEWATVSQIASLMGMKRAGTNVLLSRLKAQGRVRTWRPENIKGEQKGDTRYNIADVINAYLESEQQTKK